MMERLARDLSRGALYNVLSCFIIGSFVFSVYARWSSDSILCRLLLRSSQPIFFSDSQSLTHVSQAPRKSPDCCMVRLFHSLHVFSHCVLRHLHIQGLPSTRFVAPTARSISSIFGLGPAWFDTIKHYSRGAWWGENGKIGRLVSMISSGRTRIPTMHCGIALCLRYDVFTGYLQDVDVFLIIFASLNRHVIPWICLGSDVILCGNQLGFLVFIQ